MTLKIQEHNKNSMKESESQTGKRKSNQREKLVFVTHHNPDLDACMAIWLLKRFAFRKEDSVLKFVPMGKKLASSEAEKGNKIIYVDTSGGKYDHHDTKEYVCAASLVMEDLGLNSNLAIKRMVKYALATDHGKISSVDVNNFDLVNALEGLNELYYDHPEVIVKTILPCLDGIYESLKHQIEAEEEFKKAIVFKTKWGKGAGVISPNRKVRYLAHRKGFQVFIYINPAYGYRGFTAPGNSDVDFSELFEKLRSIEPEADWFLHSGKKLLLCGSGKAPDKKLSSLVLEKMIDLVKIE